MLLDRAFNLPHPPHPHSYHLGQCPIVSKYINFKIILRITIFAETHTCFTYLFYCMSNTPSLRSLQLICSLPSIRENRSDWASITPSANKVARVSGILKETSCFLIFKLNQLFASLKKRTVTTDKFQESAILFW